MNTVSRNAKALFAAISLILTAPVALADQQLLEDIDKSISQMRQQNLTEIQSDIRLEHSRELVFDGNDLEVNYPTVETVNTLLQQSAVVFELTARD